MTNYFYVLTEEFRFNSYKMGIRFKSDGSGSMNKGFFLRGFQKECSFSESSPIEVNSYNNNQGIPLPDASQRRNSYYPPGVDLSRIYPPYDSVPGLSSSNRDNKPQFGYATRDRQQDIQTIIGRSPLPPPSQTQLNTNQWRVNSRDPSHSVSSPSSSLPFTDNVRVSHFIPSSSAETNLGDHNANRERYPTAVSQFKNSQSLLDCDTTVNDTFFSIMSPNFPSRYPSSSKCLIIINKSSPSVCNLDLLFSSFDVGDASCRGDHLSIDGEKFCGIIPTERMHTFKFEGNTKIILFNGLSGHGHGYRIQGRQVECGDMTRPFKERSFSDRLPTSGLSHQDHASHSDSPAVLTRQPDSHVTVIPFCDQTFSTAHFTIKSPNHPQVYPNSLYCRYTIRRPSQAICGLDFKFKSFDLEESVKCGKDYLEIDTGKICGHLPPNHERRYYYFNGENEKVVTFRTDSSTTSSSISGFKLEVTQITSCNSHLEVAGMMTPSKRCVSFFGFTVCVLNFLTNPSLLSC